MVRRAAIVALAGLGLCAGPAAAEDVLVVGDSLEVGTGPHLKRVLSGRQVELDARTGRPSPEGLQVLSSRLRPGHRVVVFDVGTNDDPSRPGVLRASLTGALSLAGDRCVVVSTLRRPPLNGVPVDGLNAEIERLRPMPNVIVADWRGFTEERPALIAPDGVHATSEGYVQRAALVGNAIELCDDREKIKPRTRSPRRPKRQEPAPRPRRIHFDLGPIGALIEEAADSVVAAAEAATSAVLPAPPEPVLGAEP